MRETAAELDALQTLLERSIAAATPISQMPTVVEAARAPATRGSTRSPRWGLGGESPIN